MIKYITNTSPIVTYYDRESNLLIRRGEIVAIEDGKTSSRTKKRIRDGALKLVSKEDFDRQNSVISISVEPTSENVVLEDSVNVQTLTESSVADLGSETEEVVEDKPKRSGRPKRLS